MVLFKYYFINLSIKPNHQLYTFFTFNHCFLTNLRVGYTCIATE